MRTRLYLCSVFCLAMAQFSSSQPPNLMQNFLENYNEMQRQPSYPMFAGNPYAALMKTTEAPLDPAIMKALLSNIHNIPAVSPVLSAGDGTAEGLNKAKNHEYMLELARHRAEIDNYSQKQNEYLEQQRQYDEAVLKQKHEAMMLMQQNSYVEKLKKMKESFTLTDAANRVSTDNTGGSVLTERMHGVSILDEEKPPKSKYGDDDIETNDQHLAQFFSDKFGIDIRKGDLNEEEKEVLRTLKNKLVSEKDEAIHKGVFATMDSIKIPKKLPKNKSVEEIYVGGCMQCQPITYSQLFGNWTLMYAVPFRLKNTLATLLSLRDLSNEETLISKKNVDVVCSGMTISEEDGLATISVHHRFKDVESLEMNGTIMITDSELVTETEMFSSKACVVGSGPNKAHSLEYIVLSERDDEDSCRNLQVWTRTPATFRLRYFEHVDKMMKTAITRYGSNPLGSLRTPEKCIPALDSLDVEQ